MAAAAKVAAAAQAIDDKVQAEADRQSQAEAAGAERWTISAAERKWQLEDNDRMARVLESIRERKPLESCTRLEVHIDDTIKHGTVVKVGFEQRTGDYNYVVPVFDDLTYKVFSPTDIAQLERTHQLTVLPGEFHGDPLRASMCTTT